VRARLAAAFALLASSLAAPARADGTSARPAAVTLAEAPREVQRAMSPSALLSENRVVTRLEGASEGFVIVEAQLETRGRFRLYEDRVDFWTEGDAALGGRAWTVEVLARPESVLFPDPVSKTFKKGYQGQAVFKLKLTLPDAVANPLPVGHLIPLVVGFQACDDRQCLFPAALRVDVPLGPAAATARKSFLDEAVASLQSRLGSGQVGVGSVLILLLAGLLTAFTPCVYPLYPVTLGVFGRWSHATHVSPLFLSLSYCAGLTTSYALAGLASAASGQVFGSLTQTPAFLIAVGALILVSALAFSGLFEFPVPGFLQRFFAAPIDAGRKPSSAGLVGKAFGMGAGLGVVAAPCVGPVLVAVLAWLSASLAAGQSSYLTGAALLAVFGAGMSLPFLVLGHLILRMGRRPQLGRFTPWFKNAGTAFMVAASLFFLVPGVRLLAGPSLGAHEPLPFPTATLSTWSKERWTVLDFRADWCAACLQLEAETFRDPQVAPSFGPDGSWDFVSVDLTADTPENRAIAKDFGVVSLPSVLIAAPGGRPCAALALYSFESAPAFLDRLARAQVECR
jgi:thiol:disulfide interchange protein